MSALSDPDNIEMKPLPVKEGFTEEEAYLILQGKPLPPRIQEDEMVE
jgi:hypothetical protein